ncbi:MAG: HEAT repeat domain-containing protein [Pirellulales bacterium]|nr:HEAT repeat domain-containing protein [Pirellulales bacterium]
MIMHDLPRKPLCRFVPSSLVRRWAATAVLAGMAASSAGCQLWPWGGKVKTSLITPAMRMASIREMGPRGRDADPEEKQRLCEQLVQQIRTEPDPIVRKTIQETIGQFDTPLANAVILAGLNDDDRDVRIACCRLLAERKDSQAVAPLSKLVSADPELDVRLAAVEALGATNDEAAIPGLAAALKDRDTAMQYAGVEAMKSVTGKELGNDVLAWRQYADRVTGGEAPSASMAAQPAAETVK